MKHFLEHARAVHQGIDTRPAAVSPEYGNFLHFESEFAGEEEDFGIESPALDFLQRKDGVHRGAFEGFKSALRIFEVKSQRDAEQQVEDAPEELAVKRLALRLSFGAEPAGADGDIRSLLKGGKELSGLLDRRGQVGVAEEHDTPAGVKHAVADAVSLAVVAGIFDQMQDRIFICEGSNDVGGIVARTVVDDENLGVPLLAVNKDQDLLKRSAQSGTLVIRGDDDTVGRGQGGSRFQFSVLRNEIDAFGVRLAADVVIVLGRAAVSETG